MSVQRYGACFPRTLPFFASQRARRSLIVARARARLMRRRGRYVTHMQRAFLEYDSAFLAAMAAAPKQVRRWRRRAWAALSERHGPAV